MKIHVLIAIIQNEKGEYLIAQRPEGKTMAGLWEFPGGKREPGESPSATLVRELSEELALDLQGEIFHHFYQEQTATLLLDFYLVKPKKTLFPQSMENQQWRWIKPLEIKRYTFPPASGKVVEAIYNDALNHH